MKLVKVSHCAVFMCWMLFSCSKSQSIKNKNDQIPRDEEFSDFDLFLFTPLYPFDGKASNEYPLVRIKENGKITRMELMASQEESMTWDISYYGEIPYHDRVFKGFECETTVREFFLPDTIITLGYPCGDSTLIDMISITTRKSTINYYYSAFVESNSINVKGILIPQSYDLLQVTDYKFTDHILQLTSIQYSGGAQVGQVVELCYNLKGFSFFWWYYFRDRVIHNVECS